MYVFSAFSFITSNYEIRLSLFCSSPGSLSILLMWCVSAQQQKLNERTKSAKHSGRIETICFDMEIQLHIITLLNTNKLTANVFDVCIESERLSFCNYMYGNIIIIWLIDV